jgi:hypothetical protein
MVIPAFMRLLLPNLHKYEGPQAGPSMCHLIHFDRSFNSFWGGSGGFWLLGSAA